MKKKEQLPLRGLRPLDSGSVHMLGQITVLMVQVLVMLIANFPLMEQGLHLDNPNPTEAEMRAMYIIEFVSRVFTQITLFAVPLVYCYVTGVNYKREVNFKQGVSTGQGLLLLPIAILCIVAFMPIATLFVNALIAMGFKVGPQMSYVSSTGLYILSIIVIAAMPAFAEEIMFRSFVARGLRKFGIICALLVSSLIFALAHSSLLQLVHQIFLAMVLMTIYFATKSIYASMIVHFFNNFIALTVNFIMLKTTGSENINIGLTGAPLVFTMLGISLAGIIALVLVMWAYLYISRKRQDKYIVENYAKYYDAEGLDITEENAMALVARVGNKSYGKHDKKGNNFITKYFNLIRYLNFSFEENRLEEESKPVEQMQLEAATSPEDKQYYGDLLKARNEKNRRWDRNMVIFAVAFSTLVLIIFTVQSF